MTKPKQSGSMVYNGLYTIDGLGVNTGVESQRPPEHRAFAGDGQRTCKYSDTTDENGKTRIVSLEWNLSELDDQRIPINLLVKLSWVDE